MSKIAYLEFGRWFRGFRARRGFRSATRLSRSAGLGPNYLSELERGKVRPKAATVDRLAEAMALPADERAELHRRASLAGQSAAVRKALVAAESPNTILMRQLPALLMDRRIVDHSDTFDVSVLGYLIEEASLVLGWLELSRRGLSRTERQQLTAVCHAAIDQQLPVLRGAGLGHSESRLFDAARGYGLSAAADTWIATLFGNRRRAAKLVGELSYWNCRARLRADGVGTEPELWLVFTDPQTNENHGVKGEPPGVGARRRWQINDSIAALLAIRDLPDAAP